MCVNKARATKRNLTTNSKHIFLLKFSYLFVVVRLIVWMFAHFAYKARGGSSMCKPLKFGYNIKSAKGVTKLESGPSHTRLNHKIVVAGKSVTHV